MATFHMNTTGITMDTMSTSTEALPSINKRKISFAPAVLVYPVLAREDFTAAEKESYWSSNEDQLSYRMNAMKLVVHTRKSGHSFISMIDKSYQIAQRLSASLKQHQIESVLRDPRRYTENLEAWTLIGKGRRGLEKFTSGYHRQQRRPVVMGTKAMVCEMSRMGVSEDEIAELYAEQSRTSLIYSRMVGSADYRAAYWMEQVERCMLA